MDFNNRGLKAAVTGSTVERALAQWIQFDCDN